METSELIRRSEHCLRTGQPNLAMLYMEKAYDQCHAYRLSVASPYKKFVFAAEDMTVALSTVGEIFLTMAEAITAPARAIADFITTAAEQVNDSIHIHTTPPDLRQQFGEYPKPFEYKPKGYMGKDGGPIFPVY